MQFNDPQLLWQIVMGVITIVIAPYVWYLNKSLESLKASLAMTDKELARMGAVMQERQVSSLREIEAVKIELNRIYGALERIMEKMDRGRGNG